MKFREILIVHNPASGNHNPDELKVLIEEKLSSKDISFEYIQTSPEKDVVKITKNFDAVLVMGGDGTVMNVVSKVLDEKANISVLLIPLGTGNLLSRAIGIPLDPEQAINAQLSAVKTNKLDVGKLHTNNSYFMVSVGIGLDAEMIKHADRKQKDTFGFFAYIISGIKSISNRKKRTFELSLDGEMQTVRAHSIMIFNAARLEVVNAQIGPEVNPQDGNFDVAILRDTSPVGFMLSLFRLISGSLKEEGELEYLQAKEITVRSSGAANVQVDGDLVQMDDIAVSVLKNAISFMYIEKNS
jgi:YegS/Rv2252/BmrU family lipid kinase